ncbi:MAG: hypothetical protein ACP5N3_00100 [Candidatus Nanoarchaeia archaeon]
MYFRSETREIETQFLIGGKPTGILTKKSINTYHIHTFLDSMLDDAYNTIVDYPEEKLIFPSMPDLIKFLYRLTFDSLTDATSREIYTNSARYTRLLANGDRVYTVGHDAGILSSVDKFRNIIRNKKPTSQGLLLDQWMVKSFLRYNAININEMKKGNIPSGGYLVYAYSSDKNLKFHRKNKLNYDEWMADDFKLMDCGGEEPRTMLGEIIYKRLGFDEVQTQNIMSWTTPNAFAKLLVLGTEANGIFGHISNTSRAKIILFPEEVIKKHHGIHLEKELFLERGDVNIKSSK